MYKEYKVKEMSTGQLATAYQKLDKSLIKTAGGCWELANNRTRPANQHRLQFKSIRTADGYDVEAVKTQNLVRHRYGYIVDDLSNYERSCGNTYCLNPAHHSRAIPVGQSGKAGVLPEHIEVATRMRETGWTTEQIKSYTSAGAYLEVLRNKTRESADPVALHTMDYAVLEKIANAYRTGNPNFANLMTITGLTLDELLPYGFADRAIATRSKSNAPTTAMMIKRFAEGVVAKEIAKELGISVNKVTQFKGALYG